MKNNLQSSKPGPSPIVESRNNGKVSFVGQLNRLAVPCGEMRRYAHLFLKYFLSVLVVVMALLRIGSGAAISALERFNAETSSEYQLAAALLSEVRAALDDLLREAISLRAASSAFGGALGRFALSAGRALDAAAVPSSMGAAAEAALKGVREGAAFALESVLSSALDRFASAHRTSIAPTLADAAAAQDAMAASLATRTLAGEAADALTTTAAPGARTESIAKAVGAVRAHRDAALAFAARQDEAAAAALRAVAITRSAMRALVTDTAAAHAGPSGFGTQLTEASRRIAAASAPLLEGLGELDAAGASPLGGVGGGAGGASSAASALPLLSSLLTRPVSWDGGRSKGGGVSSPPNLYLGAATATSTTALTTAIATAATLLVPIELLPGEEILLSSAAVRTERSGDSGSFYVTNLRIVWAGGAAAGSRAMAAALEGGLAAAGADLISLPLTSLARLDATSSQLIVVTSDARVAVFTGADTASKSQSLPDLVLAAMPAALLWSRIAAFPTSYGRATSRASSGNTADGGVCSSVVASNRGWEMGRGDTLAADVARMARLAAASDSVPAPPRYHLSAANAGWSISNTYPDAFLTPTALTEASIVAAAKHRTKGRLPATVWFSGSVSLSRSSQPKSGVFSARSAVDEALLAALGSCAVDRASAAAGAGAGAGSTDVANVELAILDARPRLNAIANTARGGGVENANHYPNASLAYLNIDNIHVVRDAMLSLRSSVLRCARAQLLRALREGGPRDGEEADDGKSDDEMSGNEGDDAADARSMASSMGGNSVGAGASLPAPTPPTPTPTTSGVAEWNAVIIPITSTSTSAPPKKQKNLFRSFYKASKKLLNGIPTISKSSSSASTSMIEGGGDAGSAAAPSPRVSLTLSVTEGEEL